MDVIGQISLNQYDQKPQLMVQDFQQPQGKMLCSAKERLHKGMSGQLQEIMGLYRYEKRQLPYLTTREEIVEQVKEQGMFGTAVLLGDVAGLDDGIELAEKLRLQVMENGLSPYEVENCLAISPKDIHLLNRFSSIYCLGSFCTARKLEAANITYHMVLTPKIIANYQQQAKAFFASRQELGRVYLAVKKISGVQQFESMKDVIGRLSRLVTQVEKKKIWFALQVFAELALIEWEKSDKIKIIMLDHGKKIDLHSSELIRGLEKLIELR